MVDDGGLRLMGWEVGDEGGTFTMKEGLLKRFI
jgi:pyruvate/2-oxoglutarate/acetoin dehydrogenase E1 component